MTDIDWPVEIGVTEAVYCCVPCNFMAGETPGPCPFCGAAMTLAFDPAAEARQSVALGTYDHLAKCLVWIIRAKNNLRLMDRGFAKEYQDDTRKCLNEALVELEMARLVRDKEE